MRVSQYFNLDRTQPSLSFVDVRIDGDIPLFISPRAVRLLPSQWGDECVSLVQNFFGEVINSIRNGHKDRAIALLSILREPNETHLGLSKGRSRGRGLGSGSANDVWHALSESKAAQSGLVTDLEDTVLMIDGISVDIVSDVMTNIIRYPLVKFTQEVCTLYGIPLTDDVDSGPIWDAKALEWTSRFVALPTPRDEKLLLVPKVIVRLDMDYDVDKYYRHYVIEHLRAVELEANSELVRILKSKKNKGKKRVYKKDIEKKYGSGKAMIVRQTLSNPYLFSQYKNDNKQPSKPLTHRQLADVENTPVPDWDKLLKDVISLKQGKEHAHIYENKIEALLSTLFYPVLTNPMLQTELHQGRKRVDITFTNMATVGFFKWLSAHYPSAHIFFECKNYGKELGNPELDQISGRFSPSRGQFGIIICREFLDKEKFMLRCRDTALDGRGYVLSLDDRDLSYLIADTQTNLDFLELKVLRERFQALVM